MEIPGKTFEKIIHWGLNAYITDNNIMKEMQHRFKPNKVTTITITATYEK